MIHYSRMSAEELKREMERLKQEETRARRASMTGEMAVIERQIQFVRSYLRNPAEIKPGLRYRVEGETIPFHVNDLNGVMAWGTYEGSPIQEAIPIGILHPMEEDTDDAR
ncbi:DUF1811 family protein [Desmospora profundinema]|uniref:Type III secretory pathway component EscU n=1 Tax=Desmospora profundinema TaxID=1571184 RepID=A0ABU1IM21_9BACL|nr:DUF1811 family protein [Desmospora profundinema]MDR6225741.1 type III secretory pathway component EscU [Desmospora profundinema]